MGGGRDALAGRQGGNGDARRWEPRPRASEALEDDGHWKEEEKVNPST